jgi:hypothetical protein
MGEFIISKVGNFISVVSGSPIVHQGFRTLMTNEETVRFSQLIGQN